MVAAVEGRGLVKSYTQGSEIVDVLSGVDVDVAPGEFVSVMGPSGSGKSTLLHLLGGLDVPDTGEVLLDGRPLSSLTDDERTRARAAHVGIVYQFFNLVPVLTVAENVALPAVIAGTRPAAQRERTEELLELVGLSGHQSKLPSQLSGGQQQRVAVARALFSEPAVVLADEPTGNLDMETGAEILELFVRARRDLGQSMLMVTHDPRSAACGDRVLLLRDGVVADTLDLGRVSPDPVERTDAVLGLLAGKHPTAASGPDSLPPGGDGFVDGRGNGRAPVATPPTRSRRRRPLRAGPDVRS